MCAGLLALLIALDGVHALTSPAVVTRGEERGLVTCVMQRKAPRGGGGGLSTGDITLQRGPVNWREDPASCLPKPT